MKHIRLFIYLISCIFLFGCSKDEDIQEFSEYTMREVGEPYWDWGESPTGSAKYLDGNSLLISIFLEDDNSHWTNEDKNLVRENTKIACDYLKMQGKRYGKEVNLIYDTSIYDDLEYHMNYDESQYTGSKSSDDKYIRETLINDYINNEIDTKSLMEKYGVNSIGYMVFVDDETDKCYAYPYYSYEDEYYYPEFCVINLRWTGGYNVEPSTYAHEILHLFGARDLYHTTKYTGIYKDFVLYVDENFSSDIMLGSYSDELYSETVINSEISKLTAYFIGWTEYIAELETFPSIKMTDVASYSETKYVDENYVSYSLEEKTDDNKFKVRVITVAFVVIVFLITIYLNNKGVKKRNITDFY